jgi:ADP-L-glycero-D-manno-heptose 6-epimerase
MIVVTGAAGFIGSALVRKLNDEGVEKLILVDEFASPAKIQNLAEKKYCEKVWREDFFDWLRINHQKVDFIFHLGARTDTAEQDMSVFEKLNVSYSKQVWNACTAFNIPMLYASSAATYGDGSMGYDDNHEKVDHLEPLNPYGQSKQIFDQWVLKQQKQPPFWAGLKFFNVYGPNEYHKGPMASAIFHFFRQIAANGSVKLFRSHKEGIKDGEQRRDFIYVKDVIDVCFFFYKHQIKSGIYNIGTGDARSFNELAQAVFGALDKPPDIRFVDTPENIRNNYQYFTQANIARLRSIGYAKPFYDLEKGIEDYVKSYLLMAKYF